MVYSTSTISTNDLFGGMPPQKKTGDGKSQNDELVVS